jgi:hypothetical protein
MRTGFLDVFRTTAWNPKNCWGPIPIYVKELDDNFDQITEEFHNKDANGLLVA